MRVTRSTLKLLPSFSSARRQRSLGVVALKGGSSYLSTQKQEFLPTRTRPFTSWTGHQVWFGRLIRIRTPWRSRLIWFAGRTRKSNCLTNSTRFCSYFRSPIFFLLLKSPYILQSPDVIFPSPSFNYLHLHIQSVLANLFFFEN